MPGSDRSTFSPGHIPTTASVIRENDCMVTPRDDISETGVVREILELQERPKLVDREPGLK